MQSIALTSVPDVAMAATLLRNESTPDSTLLIGSVLGDTVQLFWKCSTGLLYAASIPATDQLTHQLNAS